MAHDELTARIKAEAERFISERVQPHFPDDSVVVARLTEFEGRWLAGYTLLGALQGVPSKQLAGNMPIWVTVDGDMVEATGFLDPGEAVPAHRAIVLFDEHGNVAEPGSTAGTGGDAE